MSTTTNDEDILLFLVELEGEGMRRIKYAFRAKFELRDFKKILIRIGDYMGRLANDPEFDRHSVEAYEWSKKLFQPLHWAAMKIAVLAAGEEGIEVLEPIGLIAGEHFPPYRVHRTDCIRFWSELKDVANTLEYIVTERFKEEEELFNNLCSLNIGKISEEDTADVCAVCMNNFVEGESVISLPCEHKFHAKCALLWLVNNPTCPMDRRNVFETGNLQDLDERCPMDVINTFETGNLQELDED